MTQSVYYRDGNNPIMIDLAQYGAQDIQTDIYLPMADGFFRFSPGVYVIDDMMTELSEYKWKASSEYEENKHILQSINNAIDKYKLAKTRRRIKLKCILKLLVCLNNHYLETLEYTYTPGGRGYLRIKENTMIGK